MEIKLLSCPLCLKPHFHGVDALRSTLISVATSQLSCPVCSESLMGLDKLTIHLFTHINNTFIDNEPSCGSSSGKAQEETTKITEKELDESINSLDKAASLAAAGNDDDGQIKCDICSFTFTDRTILDMHQKLLHQTSPDKNTGLYSYHCHLCSKKFKKRGSLMVHLRVAHYGFSNHTIEINENHTIIDGANVADANQVATSQIMDATTGNNNPKSPNELNKVHDNKQWECDVCSKMFTTKYFLKKHKRLHTGEMPYFCGQCNKSFTFQQSYHKHMLYHSSEKPYVCNECGRAFKELSTLQNHARIHSGERPFACETCGKRFRQRVSYLVHQRIHTGVMPYKCTACDKSFRYKVSQRSHKCLMNPPGSVVRVENGSEKNVLMDNSLKNNDSSAVKCIMSVDYNTGNINFIQNNDNNSSQVLYLDPGAGQDRGEMNRIDNHANQLAESSSAAEMLNEQPDLFSMVLSPLLPDVEGLCLTNHSLPEKIDEKDSEEDLRIINQLFYESQEEK